MNELFPKQAVELDGDELNLIQHGLYQLRERHGGKYKERAEILSEKLWKIQQELEKDNISQDV